MAIAAFMLIVAAILAVGCTKPDEPGNGGNGGNGGNNGGNGEGVDTQTYTITATANPTNGGTVTGGGTYEKGNTCTVTASANDGYTFTYWTENGEVVSALPNYTFSVKHDMTLVANFDIPCVSSYIDLGLPSGTLWASWNVGAASTEGYGDYFAWGEILPKDIYSLSNYKFSSGDYNKLSKYCNDASYGDNGFTDDLTELMPEDDAAIVNWGDNWRMPTREEWNELLNNTTHTWTTQYGVNGRLFTASNGASIFLPAAGYYWGDTFCNDDGFGSIYYWSSKLDTEDPYNAWVFYSSYSGHYTVGSHRRFCGQSVRAVRSVSKK